MEVSQIRFGPIVWFDHNTIICSCVDVESPCVAGVIFSNRLFKNPHLDLGSLMQIQEMQLAPLMQMIVHVFSYFITGHKFAGYITFNHDEQKWTTIDGIDGPNKNGLPITALEWILRLLYYNKRL